MQRWLPRLPLLLAAIAQVGGLMPLALLAAFLVPKEGPSGPAWHLPLPGGALSPLLLFGLWFGGWLINERAKRRQAILSPLLLAAGLALAWLAQPQAQRAIDPFFPLLVLPVQVAAWWGGGAIGATGLYWHTAFEGLRRSLWLCLAGLLILWLGAPPVTGAFTGPFLLFGAGLTLLFMLRLKGGAIPLRTATAALGPLLLVAFIAALANPVWIGSILRFIGTVLGPVVEGIALPFGYLAALIQRLLLWGLSRRAPEEPPPDATYDPQLPPELTAVKPSEGVVHFTAWFLILLGVVGLWYLVRWLMATSRWTEESADQDEIRTGPGMVKGLMGDLRALLGARFGAEARTDALPANDPRRLLRRLQLWGAAKGRERGVGETPLQYAKALTRHLPRAADATDLDGLAAAYASVRYGSGTPAPSQVEGAERLLDELERS